VKARHIATGTLLAASLTIGAGAAATAAPSRPAMDRFEVPCTRIEHRIDHLEHHEAMLEARRGRLDARLADARANGEIRRIRVLEAQLRQVDRAADRIQARLDVARARYADFCEPEQTS